ncbi:MAG: hypothetical protein AAGU27_16230 [Dehalobacterium sp.]
MADGVCEICKTKTNVYDFKEGKMCVSCFQKKRVNQNNPFVKNTAMNEELGVKGYVEEKETPAEDSKERGISGFWIFIAIVGILISLTGVGATVGVPMIGIAIMWGAIHGGSGKPVLGCIAIVFIVVVILIALLMVLTRM